MILDYNRFYKKYGIKFLQDFLYKGLADIEELRFPKLSTFHYYDSNNDKGFPNTAISYLSYKKKIPLINRTKLVSDESVMNVKQSALLPIVSQARHTGKFLIADKNTIISSSDLVPIIFNYSVLDAIYNYKNNNLSTYFKWKNTFRTIVTGMAINRTNTARKQYLIVTPPKVIPNHSLFLKHEDKLITSVMRDFVTPDSLTILDIWRWLNPKTREISILGTVDKDSLKNLNFIFMVNGNWIVINLGRFYSFIKENEIDTSYSKLSFRQIQKVFISMLVRMSYSAAQNDSLLMASSFSTPEQEEIVPTRTLNNIVTDSVEIIQSSEIINSAEVPNVEIDEDVTATIKVDNTSQETIVTDTDALEKKGIITKTVAKKIKEIANKQKEIKSLYSGGKLTDAMNVSEEDIALPLDSMAVPDMPMVLDKDMLTSTVGEIDSKYISTVMKKDILRSIYAMQNNGVLVTNHEVEKTSTILGDVETHKITFKPLVGNQTTVSIKMPVVAKDGTFMMNGSTYVMSKQRADMPIKKLSYNRVALSSYYGKLFIDRSNYKKDDSSYWLRSKLIKMYSDDGNKLTNLVAIGVIKPDWPVPSEYALFSRQIKGFKLGEYAYMFNYSTRQTILSDVELPDVEKDGKVLVGRKGNTPVVMSPDNRLFLVENKKYIKIPSILEQLDISMDDGPTEFTTLKIYSKRLPLGIVFSYYLGITKALKLLKTEYKLIDLKDKVASSHLVVRFKDTKMIIKKTDRESCLLFGGFNAYKAELLKYSFIDFDNKDVVSTLLLELKIPNMYIIELGLLNSMFIDPMTKDLLKSMGEPTTFKALLLRGNEMLLDDEHTPSQSLDTMYVRGYERMAGMMYKQLSSANRAYTNTSVFKKTKLDIDPYSVWRAISSDATVMPQDDLNPIANLKQYESVTYTGFGGRSKETMSKDTRQYSSSDLGVISEAHKDSGDVGISMYLSGNPKFKNIRGIKGDTAKLNSTNLLSTSSLLAPGAINDDPKRANFTSVQNSHSVPIVGRMQPYVRTGYENVLPYRVGPKFALMAKQDGDVVSVTTDNIKIIYKNGDKDSATLGPVATKTENGSGYKHVLRTTLVKGSKFKKGDAIMFNSAFFGADFFDKSKLVYLVGTNMYTAMLDIPVTDEDSCAVSRDIVGTIATVGYKVKSIILDSSQEVLNLVKVGSKVSFNDPLLTITDKSIVNKTIDTETLALLSGINKKAPKAKVEGTIDKVVVLYNASVDEMSDSLKEIVARSDRTQHRSGEVTSEYSIQGKPLTEGMVEIKIYISTLIGAGVGDKGIFANQLKSTIGEVYASTITDEYGNKIDALFGETAAQARIVESVKTIGTTTTLLDVIAIEACKLYD